MSHQSLDCTMLIYILSNNNSVKATTERFLPNTRFTGSPHVCSFSLGSLDFSPVFCSVSGRRPLTTRFTLKGKPQEVVVLVKDGDIINLVDWFAAPPRCQSTSCCRLVSHQEVRKIFTPDLSDRAAVKHTSLTPTLPSLSM